MKEDKTSPSRVLFFVKHVHCENGKKALIF